MSTLKRDLVATAEWARWHADRLWRAIRRLPWDRMLGVVGGLGGAVPRIHSRPDPPARYVMGVDFANGASQFGTVYQRRNGCGVEGELMRYQDTNPNQLPGEDADSSRHNQSARYCVPGPNDTPHGLPRVITDYSTALPGEDAERESAEAESRIRSGNARDISDYEKLKPEALGDVLERLKVVGVRAPPIRPHRAQSEILAWIAENDTPRKPRYVSEGGRVVRVKSFDDTPGQESITTETDPPAP